LVGRIAGLLLKTPLVISSQRSIDVWRKWYHWQVDKFTSIWADLIISNSFSGREVLIKKAHIPKEKIIVIPNGISNEKVQPTINKESFGLKKSDYLVGTVGNLKTAKGHIYLIKGAERVLKEFPNTFFLIAGEGPLKNSLLQEIGKRGMIKNFIFTGFRSDVEELIQLFDIFVLPSLWEGFPVSLLEAMKYGKSTVAFGVADIPYIIENNISGFVVEPKSYVQLADKIIMLIKDKKIRHQTGISAKIRVEENFGLEKMVSDYTSVYIETLKKRLH
jgi:glycosyltransferase involved in cell wall biosynthesis